MKLLKYLALPAILLSLMIIACDDEDEDLTGSEVNYEVRLTDNPALFDAVNVEINQVSVNHEAEGWINLNTNEGIYDLLTLTNGVSETIAEDEIPEGSLSQIQLELGNSNTVVVDGISHGLTMADDTSVIAVNIHQQLEAGNDYTILLDFDAANSILLTADGDYEFTPVIHAISEGTDAGISGRLKPEIQAQILAINQVDSDTTGTYTDGSGSFLIQGLESGDYQVIITPDAPYNELTFDDISVEEGEVYDMGIIPMQ